MMIGRVFQIYSKDNCPYCQNAVKLLTEQGYPHNVVKLNDTEERNAMYDRFGLVGKLRTVPQIVAVSSYGEDHIGGYEDLLEYLAD